jgi:glycosyltransferase involved in cell wall biosynthesis
MKYHEIFSQKRQNICVLEQSLITKYSEITNINRLLKIMNREDLLMNINDYRKIDQRNIEEIKLADVVICPSKFVQQDVLMRVPSANTVIIPYGVTNKKEGQVKIKHRVSLKKILTVGEVGLRKGSPSIWQIAKKFNHLEFEMIGPINLDEEFLRTKPSNVTLRGVQPYSEVSQAYLESDLFLLPSVAEGSATVIYEAVQHGLPVACSIQSGSVLENMSEAVIFDAFDLSDTAKAISFLNDATIRKKYSEKATQKASLYTKEAYQAKIVSKLKDICKAI